MTTARKPPSAVAPALLVLAGLALLASALLNRDASDVVVGLGLVGALTFFVAGHLGYRRAR